MALVKPASTTVPIIQYRPHPPKRLAPHHTFTTAIPRDYPWEPVPDALATIMPPRDILSSQYTNHNITKISEPNHHKVAIRSQFGRTMVKYGRNPTCKLCVKLQKIHDFSTVLDLCKFKKSHRINRLALSCLNLFLRKLG